MDKLVATLLAWIVAQTGLAAPNPPRIVFVPKYQLSELYRGVSNGEREPQAIFSNIKGARNPNDPAGVQAFYVRDDATIYLQTDWRPVGLRNQSILLHELVHHVQRFNRVNPSCPGSLEKRAYDLQAEWLRERSVRNPSELIGSDQLTVAILTACMPDDP